MKLAALLVGYLLILLISQYLNISISFNPRAQAVSNNNYNLEVRDLSITIDRSNSKPTVKGEQTSNIPLATFTFSIDQTRIDFGTLSPTNPVTRTNILTVSGSLNTEYSIFAFEDHPLAFSLDKAVIPDTTCDAGICNQTIGALWNSILSYGFGYRCKTKLMTPCDKSMLNIAFYKQFSDNSNGEGPELVLSSTEGFGSQTSQIFYKVNVSGTQKTGLYSNTITYIAVPNF